MKKDRASITAEFVAFGRAMAQLESGALHLDDPFAKDTLPGYLRRIVERAERPKRGVITRSIVRATSGGLVEHMAFRTYAIDRAVQEAADAGATQCVIMGAGMDMRAYRLPALAKLDVFEVDHPASQSKKKHMVQKRGLSREQLHHVAVEFGQDDVNAALDAAGHRTDERTVWIWEGVTMYLPREAFLGTVQLMAARSCEGSRLAVTYFLQSESAVRQWIEQALQWPFGMIGEPIVGAMPTRALHADLRDAGFEIVRDENDVDWSAQRGANIPLIDAFLGERLAIADRRKKD